MSQGLCPSCGAAVNVPAGKTETKCQYCETVVTQQQADAQFAEVKNSKLGGMLLLAETAQEGGGYEEALSYYNKVIEQDPTFAGAWLNKGICIVRTSKIGDIKIPEAIAAWKAAIKFAKNPDAMKMRVALEITRVVASFYPVLENHYNKFHAVDGGIDNFFERFVLLDSALSLAMELHPNSVSIPEMGAQLCGYFIKTCGGNLVDTLSEKVNEFKEKYDAIIKERAKTNPELAAKLETEREKQLMHHHKVGIAYLAILFGFLGFHKFQLGCRTAGIVMLCVSLTLFGLLITVPISWIEAIIYFSKSDEEFEKIYMQGKRSWF